MSQSDVDIFAPPQVERAFADVDVGSSDEHVKTRRRHLRREGAIKSVGWLCYGMGVMGFFQVITQVIMMAMMSGASGMMDDEAFADDAVIFEGGDELTLWSLLLSIFFTVGWFVSGRGISTLRHYGRVVGTLLVVVTVITALYSLEVSRAAVGDTPGGGSVMAFSFAVTAIMLGLMITINALLWTRPAPTIFSDSYRLEVIPATPKIRARFPWWAIVLLILIGLMILFMVLAVIIVSFMTL